MRPGRKCLGRCGRTLRSGSYCMACQKLRHREDTRRRRETEPWRFLYGLQAWKTARATRRDVDEHRCVDCGAPGEDVDHETPIRRLWELALDRDHFVALAIDVSRLRTRCRSCHLLVEYERRRAA